MADTFTTPLKPKKKNAFRKFLWRFCFFLLLLLGLFIYWNYYNIYSDGERTGLLIKLSRKGNLFKTYEGEMLIGNYQQASTVMVPEKFLFSVKEAPLADTLMKLQGKIISLKYNQYRKILPWRGETDYMIVGLVPVSHL